MASNDRQATPGEPEPNKDIADRLLAALQQDEFVLSAALQNRPITLSLRLKPIALPLVMRGNTPISVGSINWVVVPRLAATGIVTVDHRVYPLVDAPTYHDHNWGKWLWGHDFAWEWGFALSEDENAAWSVVFDRTTNRARSRTMELTLALWKDAEIFRVFTQREIRIQPSGYLTLERLPKFPRVMALVAPETTTDIPRYFDIRDAVNGSHGYFDAGRVTVIAPRWHGVNLETSYWLSKAIDTGAAYTNTATGDDGRQSQSQTEKNIWADVKSVSRFD